MLSQKMTKVLSLLQSMKTRLSSTYARCASELSPPLKSREFSGSSTLASATKENCLFPSNTMALTQADGRALIKSISRISPVVTKRRRHLRTPWLRPMVTSLSTATRLKSRRVSSSGWQGKLMLLSSSAKARMSTPYLPPKSTGAPYRKVTLWNGSLAKPVFWV